MKLVKQTGKVRDFDGWNVGLMHEAKIHFDCLVDRYPDAGFIEMRISKDGEIYAAVEDVNVGHSPWKHTDESVQTWVDGDR